jgi:hypothetical protein
MRRKTALLAAIPPLLALGLTGPGTAQAQPQAGSTVKIIVDAHGPLIGDSSNVIYDVDVKNTGPAKATGLVLRAVSRACYSTDVVNNSECDERNREYFHVSDLNPGEVASFPYLIELTDDDAAQLRTTIRVVDVDQMNTGSAGGCQSLVDIDDSCVVLVHTIQE